ncbi:hypothetical protein [Paludisphaera borealis]|uniref:Uncharacterized protein n=1 Tax=Paludisphaera borealis TaxID=1387353 RepID=A0A1U7CPV5_9BACT|nr:hypothetical protein [Paludisphaera borealis]APW60975.1 hypothetical protein BSF38_02472 [Paludisphaera borealis]
MNINDRYSAAEPPPDDTADSRECASRLYVHEAGWRISIKRGSVREFCYVMAPDQDYYHRLVDGEIYLHQADERICLSCAVRRGIIAYEPRRLRDEPPIFLVDAGELPLYVPGVDDL